MKTPLVVLCLAAVLLPLSQAAAVPATETGNVHSSKATLYEALPLSFSVPCSPSDTLADYVTQGSGYMVSLSRNQVALHLRHTSVASRPKKILTNPALRDGLDEVALRMQIRGSQPGPRGMGMDELPGKVNYLIGNDSSKWQSGLPTYAKVKYAGVYPGIDVVYYGNQRNLEFDFNLQPGADPRAVRLEFDPADKSGGQIRLAISPAGDLLIHHRHGDMVLPRPVVYQQELAGSTNSRRQPIEGGYFLVGTHEVGFRVGPYDKSRTLVIDPTVAYSLRYGGVSNVTEPTGIAVDPAGNAYVTGYTMSDSLPISPGAVEKAPTRGFVSKFNASGTTLLYSTYFGGQMDDAVGRGIAVDASGDAYVTGSAVNYSNFPVTPGAFQTTAPANSTPSFVSKLNRDGSSFIYSTFLGGTAVYATTTAQAIDVDASGNAYITGETLSADFPTTPGSYLPKPPPFSSNPQDAFVTKLNASGSALLYSTFLGPTGSQGLGIKVDASGAAYVAGFTGAPFPTTPNAFSKTGTGFVTKLNPSGSDLEYATLLQGSDEAPYAIAIDKVGNAYITGSTVCDLPVTADAYQPKCRDITTDPNNPPGGDAFVTKLNPTGTALLFSTYLGGSGRDEGHAIAVNSNGDVNISGVTVSSDFPVTPGAFEPNFGGYGQPDGFYAQLNATGTDLLYATFLGGESIDNATGIAVDSSDNIFVTGYSFGSAPPTTPGSYQPYGEGSWVIKFAPSALTGTTLNLSLSPLSDTFRQPVTATATLKPYVESNNGTDGEPISFYANGVLAGTARLVSGKAKLTDPRVPTGSYTVTAVYGGDANFSASTSSAVSLQVQPAATRVTLSSDRNPQAVNEPVNLTAAVSPVSAGGTPLGSVSFYDGKILLGQSKLEPATGAARLKVRFETGGQHTITAVYVSLHGNFAGSTSPPLIENVIP